MHKGYVIIIRDYIAEICEFTTIEIINAPDDTKIYHVTTKYGEDYFKESEISPIKKALEKQCDEMNIALSGVKNAGGKNQSH